MEKNYQSPLVVDKFDIPFEVTVHENNNYNPCKYLVILTTDEVKDQSQDVAIWGRETVHGCPRPGSGCNTLASYHHRGTGHGGTILGRMGQASRPRKKTMEGDLRGWKMTYDPWKTTTFKQNSALLKGHCILII